MITSTLMYENIKMILIILIMRDHDTFSEATLLIDAFETIFLNLPQFQNQICLEQLPKQFSVW